MVAVVDDATADVLTGNVALTEPAAMVTVDGTVAELLLLESATVTEEGALAFRVTVPVALDPPRTEVGDKVRLCSKRGVIVSVAVGDEPLKEAVTVAVAVVGTIPVVTVKVAVVLPEDTTTLAGTVAAVVPETESVTVSLAGAALESVRL